MKKVYGRKRYEHRRRSLKVFVGILFALLILYAGICNSLAGFALKPDSSANERLRKDGQADDDLAATVEADGALTDAWLSSMGYSIESLSIVSEDGLELKATCYPQPPRRDAGSWAIVVHGYHGSAKDMAGVARRFYEAGYSVLTPDLQAHGESAGKYIGMGWPDRLALVQWANEIVRRNPEARIVLYGLSMGGAAVMMASGEALPENVRAIVEDGGFTSVWDIFAYQLDRMFNLPPFPLMQGAERFSRLRAGYGWREASAVEQVKKSSTPILFIHGGDDLIVPTSMVYTVYGAAACEKELFVVDGAGNGMAQYVDPAGYWDTVFGFIGQYTE